MPTAPGPPGRSSGAFICRCQSQTPRPVPTRQARTLGRSAGVRVLSLLWQGPFWVRSPEWWRLALSVSLFALACALSWTAARALGRHLRIDASVDSTHELVRSGRVSAGTPSHLHVHAVRAAGDRCPDLASLSVAAGRVDIPYRHGNMYAS